MLEVILIIILLPIAISVVLSFIGPLFDGGSAEPRTSEQKAAGRRYLCYLGCFFAVYALVASLA